MCTHRCPKLPFSLPLASPAATGRCRVLQRVPGSVLWLLRFPPEGEPNLRKEAADRGIGQDRRVDLIPTDISRFALPSYV